MVSEIPRRGAASIRLSGGPARARYTTTARDPRAWPRADDPSTSLSARLAEDIRLRRSGPGARPLSSSDTQRIYHTAAGNCLPRRKFMAYDRSYDLSSRLSALSHQYSSCSLAA